MRISSSLLGMSLIKTIFDCGSATALPRLLRIRCDPTFVPGVAHAAAHLDVLDQRDEDLDVALLAHVLKDPRDLVLVFRPPFTLDEVGRNEV